MISVFLCLTYFTKRNTIQVNPCCCQWQDFIFYSQVIFHCVYIYIRITSSSSIHLWSDNLFYAVFCYRSSSSALLSSILINKQGAFLGKLFRVAIHCGCGVGQCSVDNFMALRHDGNVHRALLPLPCGHQKVKIDVQNCNSSLFRMSNFHMNFHNVRYIKHP